MDAYTIDKKIGEGGCATVYAGICKATSQPVAIKVINKSAFGLSPPEQEAEMLERVKHVDGVVKIIDNFQLSGGCSHVIVMEKPAECCDLYNYIGDRAVLSEYETRRLFVPILKTVNSLFKMGIVHRDIKDENIVIDLTEKKNKPILIDFGFADSVDNSPFSRFFGTKEFMAPECWTRHSYEAESSTVWSLGILLYDMLHGDVPFLTTDDAIKGAFSFGVLSHGCEGAKDVISACLSLDPDLRPTLDELSEMDFFV